MLGYVGRCKSHEEVYTALDRPLDILLYLHHFGGYQQSRCAQLEDRIFFLVVWSWFICTLELCVLER
jgi:hypothetical protein